MIDITIITKKEKIFSKGNVTGAGFTVNSFRIEDGIFTTKKRYAALNDSGEKEFITDEIMFNIEQDLELLIIGGVVIYPKSQEEEV